jgi:hypothetical protein
MTRFAASRNFVCCSNAPDSTSSWRAIESGALRELILQFSDMAFVLSRTGGACVDSWQAPSGYGM